MIVLTPSAQNVSVGVWWPQARKSLSKNAFEKLAANPKLAVALGQRGKAHVKDIFDKERNVSLFRRKPA